MSFSARHTLCAALAAGCWCITLTASAAEPRIPLKRGVYVQADTPCKDAPFAAMKSWDGKGFGDPHNSRCTAHVLRAQGKTFDVEDTCTALGDGTSAQPNTERDRLTITGPASFRVAPLGSPGAEAKPFRWCAAR